MAHSFITKDNIYTRYVQAKRYTDLLTEPFPEFQRIARNRPFPGIDKAYPKTTDGTTASIIQKTPKRVVQQLPTGVIEADNDDHDWLPIVAQFIYTNKILPYANEDYGLLEKSHLAIEAGLTFGSACSLAPFVNHDGYFCPDMVLPYWGDVFLQPGKKSGPACSYVFIRAWWQKADIEALIDSENKLKSDSDKRLKEYKAALKAYEAELAAFAILPPEVQEITPPPEEPTEPAVYEPTWDVSALGEVLDGKTLKDDQARTPVDNERDTNPSGIELVTAFQKGKGAKFYTFSPSAEVIVRTKVNKDPRGKIPIDWFYGDIDGNNPLGRGIVELIGGLQNLIDSDMQMYQYNRALMLAPPVIKYGNVGDFKFAPNAVISALNPATDKIEVLQIDTSAVTNYPALYGLQKSQLLNLVTSPDTSISAEIGNPGFGKTPTAINQQAANISVDDNAIRKRFETWFQNWSETAVNLYFAERAGKEILQLDDDTADELRALAEKGKFDPQLLNDNNQLIIDYDEATPALKFRIDASTSKMKDETNQAQAVAELLTAVSDNVLLTQLLQQYPEKLIGAYNSLVAASSVEDPELLKIDIDDFKQKQLMAQQQAMQQQAAQAQLPAEAMPAQPQDDLEPQIAQHMQQLGFSPQAIEQALSMSRQGANEQQIAQALGVQSA